MLLFGQEEVNPVCKKSCCWVKQFEVEYHYQQQHFCHYHEDSSAFGFGVEILKSL